MGRGIKSYSEKQRREQRRRNHIAKDLGTPKYRQRVQKRRKDIDDWEEDDYE